MRAHTIGAVPHLRRALATIALAGPLLLMVGSAQAATGNVKAVNFEFQPSSLTIKAGDVVHWSFSGETHTVTSGTPGAPDGRFDSGFKDPGGSFQVTFDRPGTFPFFCQIHSEQMFGTIVVTAGPTSTPAPTAKASPTAKPTAKLTERPTEEPTATATEAPSATRSAAPTATSTAAASPTAAPAEPSSGTSSTPGTTANPSPGPNPEPAAATGLNPLVVVGGAIVLGLLVAGGLVLARRRPRA